MKKNYQVHLYLDKELFEALKRESHENGNSVSELCRQKLKQLGKLDRIAFMLERIEKKINHKFQ